MASWHQWVEDKVKDALTQGEQKSYYHLLPQRNPNDPADRAVSAAGKGLYSGVAGGVPERVGQAIQATGLAPETGTAIRQFGEGNKIPANYPTGWERGIHNVAEGFAPAVAIPAAAGMTGVGMLPGTLANTAISDLSQGQVGRERAVRSLQQAIPNETMPSHAPGQYPLANAALNPALPPTPAMEPRPAPIVLGGNGGGPGVGPNGAIRPGDGSTMPTAAIPDTYNELTRWDLARNLTNAGIDVPQMSREEMATALRAKPGQGGIANLGTMPDNQRRDLMDRRGLNYFKMTDQQMRQLWQPIEQKNMANRPQALFSGDESRGQGGPAGAPTYDQALNTALQMLMNYSRDPERFGPHYLQGAISAIQHLPVSKEYPQSAAAERGYKDASAEYAHAHAGLVPSEIAKNEAISTHYKAEGENKPFLLPPGYEAYVPSKQIGSPASKIAEGAKERAGTAGAIEHMTEGDKIMLQGAWHALGNEMDPKQREMYQGVIDSINNKYAGPAGGKPPVPGATLRKHPGTGQAVWVDPSGKVIPQAGQ